MKPYQRFISVTLWAETKHLGREMALDSNEPFVGLMARLIEAEARKGNGPGDDSILGKNITTAKIRLETMEAARPLMETNRESFAELAHRLIIAEKNRREQL